MGIYIVTIFDYRKCGTILVGAYSTLTNAYTAMKDAMAADYGQNEYTDWDSDFTGGQWWYFYEGYTAQIERTILDD